MANEHVNKVVFGGNTLIDLTTDTVTPETLSRGVTAHNAAGRQIVGVNDGSSQAFMTCSISDSDISSSSDNRVVHTTQLETGTYSQAYSAIESGTPMILQIAVQSEDETTQELTTDSYLCVPISYADVENDIGGVCTLDEGVNLAVKITSEGVVTVTLYFSRDSKYYVDISCTAQELLSGSFNSNLGSGTFAKVLDASSNGKDVCVRMHVNNDFIIGNILLSVFYPPQETSESSLPGYAFGSTTVRTSFDGTEKLWNIAVRLASNDTANITTVVVAEREIIPINMTSSEFTQFLTSGSFNTTITSGTISKVDNLLASGTLVYAQIKVNNESQRLFCVLFPLISSATDSSTQISGSIPLQNGLMQADMRIDDGTEIFELRVIDTAPRIVSANYTRVADNETLAGLSITGAEFNAAYNTYLYKSTAILSNYSIADLTSYIRSGKDVKFSIRGLKYPRDSLVINLPDVMIDQVQADNNGSVSFSGLYYSIFTPVMVQGIMFEYNDSRIIYCFAKKADYLMSTSASGVSF